MLTAVGPRVGESQKKIIRTTLHGRDGGGIDPLDFSHVWLWFTLVITSRSYSCRAVHALSSHEEELLGCFLWYRSWRSQISNSSYCSLVVASGRHVAACLPGGWSGLGLSIPFRCGGRTRPGFVHGSTADTFFSPRCR